MRAARSLSQLRVLAAIACAIALAGCNTDNPQSTGSISRGASVAFESIDGPPPGQFQELVQALNDEAQTRQLAVVSRESPSAFHVRGYLAAVVVRHNTTISWVWDVFDRDEHRVLRITGAEAAKGRHHNAWAVADDAMLRRIASSSMQQLATFLTAPEVAPGTPDVAPQLAAFSPESLGIFRITQPTVDPEPATEPAAAPSPQAVPLPPLPPHRSPPAAAVSAQNTLTAAPTAL